MICRGAIQLIFFSICGIVGHMKLQRLCSCQDSCNFHPTGRQLSHRARKRKEDFANHNDKELNKISVEETIIGWDAGTQASGTVMSKQGGPLSLRSSSYMACLTETLAMPKDPVSCHIVPVHFERYELGRWSRCIGEHGWRFILGAGALFLHCLLQFLPNKKYNKYHCWPLLVFHSRVLSHIFF